MYQIFNFIHGEKKEPRSGKYLPNFDPAMGEIYSELPDSDERDTEDAIAAAQQAFVGWSQTPPDARANILWKIADLIEENLGSLARSETLDTGKPIRLSTTVDIPRAAANFRFFAAAATQFASESHSMPEAVNYTLRESLGVVACISPWNLPLYLLSWKVAPALAAGNTVVAKPSEHTPTTAFELAEIVKTAGLPPGVLNIVQGLGSKIGPILSTHPKIKAISFTGSTRTGADIAVKAAPFFKKLSLEMGGKNPTIIFADCDFERMMPTVLRSSFSNQGQICLCGSRIFVEAEIYQKFKSEFVKQTSALKIGDPREDDTDQGSLISKEHFEKVGEYVELAKKEGGKILIGGSPYKPAGRCHSGWFFSPTIIEGISFDCRVNREEIFGPVVSLIPFQSEDELIYQSNSVSYGLSASIWSRDMSRCHRLAEKIKAGVVWINTWMLRDLRTPFGGMKDSGMGREGGLEAFRFFTEPKNICLKY